MLVILEILLKFFFYFLKKFLMSFAEINKRKRAKLWQIFRFALLFSKKKTKNFDEYIQRWESK